MPRSLAAAASPALAGALFAAGHQDVPLIACGVLKILYDIVLLWTFRHIRPPEKRWAATEPRIASALTLSPPGG